MRLHRLTAAAFGPFVDTVSVDFDDLSAGGLFLLTGDTGAGKSSVLDAVCFALYGEVPGDRHTARHLRSDQADPTADPRVTLELTVGNRTFRFTRSPAWHRPKKRGSGSTRVQAHVVVEELRDGSWSTLTTRLDEAGQLVTSLLGMTCTQFTQVAMLPQNRFQTFLRASSSERQAVLQRLFRTERFEAVERWLVERRLSLHRKSQASQAQVAAVVHRFQEAADAGTPEGWDSHDLEVPSEDGSLRAWAEARVEAAADAATTAAESLEIATAELDESTRDRDQGREAHELRQRGAAARRVLRELTETTTVERDCQRRLEAHRRSLPVVPLVQRAGRATLTLDDSEEAASTHVAAVAAVLEVDEETVDLAALERAATRAAEDRAVAESWLPREQELLDERERASALAEQAEELSASLQATQEAVTALDPRREALVIEAEEHAHVAATVADRRSQVEVVELAWQAARDAATLGTQLTRQRQALTLATQRTQDLRHEHLDLREARIAGMAAELATGLAVGCSCPVCGSAQHPAPATSTSRVTREDEEQARQRHESAAFEQQALQESVATLETQLQAALVRSAGHRAPYWQRRHVEAGAAVTVAEASVERVASLREELVGLDAAERDLTASLADTRAALAERSAGLKHAMLRRDALQADLEGMLATHGAATVAELVAHLVDMTAALGAAREALARADKAREDHRIAVSEAVAAAQEAGFDSPRQALAAHLTDAVAARHEADLEARRVARSRATDTLAERAVLAALDASEPDLQALADAVTATAERRDNAHAAHQQAATRSGRLAALCAELDRATEAWDPVRREHAVTAALSALVEGKSADNALRMRLAAYVLSERLRQVVEAANERLARMTDQRYSLEQADERGAGEQRGGLSLRVRDQWSGKRRDPATLSGGETFLVSLALALGLADTVSHEAGGTQLDTLFIDEGFGALDATTLDGVMDTLDSLRDGGRVVGLVSHVPELRNRVVTQLEVRKGRRGSTIVPTTNH